MHTAEAAAPMTRRGECDVAIALLWYAHGMLACIVHKRGLETMTTKDERLPKTLLNGYRYGSGVRGRSHKQRVECVKENLPSTGLSFTWWREAQDKAGWRATIEHFLQIGEHVRGRGGLSAANMQ